MVPYREKWGNVARKFLSQLSPHRSTTEQERHTSVALHHWDMMMSSWSSWTFFPRCKNFQVVDHIEIERRCY
jgi:hypothetical protein